LITVSAAAEAENSTKVAIAAEVADFPRSIFVLPVRTALFGAGSSRHLWGARLFARRIQRLSGILDHRNRREFATRLAEGAQSAIRWTKYALNIAFGMFRRPVDALAVGFRVGGESASLGDLRSSARSVCAPAELRPNEGVHARALDCR
jgi:hypothetical protein